MQSCDPGNDWTDPLPPETRVEKLVRWLREGRGQRVLAAREHARRRFVECYGRAPTQKQWSQAMRIAGGGQ